MTNAMMQESDVLDTSIEVSAILLPGVLTASNFENTLMQDQINLVYSVVLGHKIRQLCIIESSHAMKYIRIQNSIYKQYPELKGIIDRNFGPERDTNLSELERLEEASKEISEYYGVDSLVITHENS